MNFIRKTLAVSAMSALLMGTAAFAQDHHDDHHDNHDNHGGPGGGPGGPGGGPGGPHGGYVHHNDWQRGHRMNGNDWGRGQRIDYRQYHLSAPRRGYEWREVDGNYVMAAVATGLIASVIIAGSR